MSSSSSESISLFGDSAFLFLGVLSILASKRGLGLGAVEVNLADMLGDGSGGIITASCLDG